MLDTYVYLYMCKYIIFCSADALAELKGSHICVVVVIIVTIVIISTVVGIGL